MAGVFCCLHEPAPGVVDLPGRNAVAVEYLREVGFLFPGLRLTSLVGGISAEVGLAVRRRAQAQPVDSQGIAASDPVSAFQWQP